MQFSKQKFWYWYWRGQVGETGMMGQIFPSITHPNQWVRQPWVETEEMQRFRGERPEEEVGVEWEKKARWETYLWIFEYFLGSLTWFEECSVKSLFYSGFSPGWKGKRFCKQHQNKNQWFQKWFPDFPILTDNDKNHTRRGNHSPLISARYVSACRCPKGQWEAARPTAIQGDSGLWWVI